MSPRSEELIGEARARLRAARANLELGEWAVAASAAYYSMLYSARAALSERDLYAKTHSGTWNLLWQHLVESGELDRDLVDEARRAQRIRELGDYEAQPPSREQAEDVVSIAARLLEQVTAMHP